MIARIPLALLVITLYVLGALLIARVCGAADAAWQKHIEDEREQALAEAEALNEHTWPWP